MELFNNEPIEEPLAYRMSPRDINEYVGQEHILGEGKLLRRALEADRITSLILYGPPGTGKTALAKVIAKKTMAHFEWLNAATAGLDELRKIIQSARTRKAKGMRTILFLDEIHRFNKLQQDALLPDVEEGNITLIAATVENPFFYVNSALLSRSQVFELKPLSEENILKIKKALSFLQDNAVKEVNPDDIEKYEVVRLADEITIDLLKKACDITYDKARAEYFEFRCVCLSL